MKKSKKTDGCTRYDHLVWDYLEMDPDDPQRFEINNHLKSCENCRILFERTAGILQYLDFQRTLTPSPELSKQILNRFHEKKTTVVRLIYTLKSLAAAAIVVFMVAAGVFSGRFIAGKMVSEQTANIVDPVSSFAEETFFAEADFFTPGYELLNE